MCYSLQTGNIVFIIKHTNGSYCFHKDIHLLIHNNNQQKVKQFSGEEYATHILFYRMSIVQIVIWEYK